jgi:hypothetical protein
MHLQLLIRMFETSLLGSCCNSKSTQEMSIHEDAQHLEFLELEIMHQRFNKWSEQRIYYNIQSNWLRGPPYLEFQLVHIHPLNFHIYSFSLWKNHEAISKPLCCLMTAVRLANKDNLKCTDATPLPSFHRGNSPCQSESCRGCMEYMQSQCGGTSLHKGFRVACNCTEFLKGREGGGRVNLTIT